MIKTAFYYKITCMVIERIYKNIYRSVNGFQVAGIENEEYVWTLIHKIRNFNGTGVGNSGECDTSTMNYIITEFTSDQITAMHELTQLYSGMVMTQLEVIVGHNLQLHNSIDQTLINYARYIVIFREYVTGILDTADGDISLIDMITKIYGGDDPRVDIQSNITSLLETLCE